MDERPGGGKGAELGEREQEKFTGEWVDATRPSNRRLDYSARRHIGRVRVRTCERACVCIRFSSCILLLSPEYRLSLYPFRSLSLPLSLLPSSIGLAFFPSSRSRFLRNTDRGP